MPRKSAFKCYFGCIPYKDHDILPRECLDTADFLLLMDKLFNSFYGHSYQNSEKIYKSALKKNSLHFKLWNDSLPILRSMQFKVEKKLRDGTTSTKFEQVPSLKNWISNINVYKEMFKYLNETYGVSSLLTRNINQDPLENFFCNIRSNGVRNPSPTCSQFIGAFKTLLVSNLTSPHSVGANCEQDEALCEFVDDVCMIIQTQLNDEPQQKCLKCTPYNKRNCKCIL